MISFTCCRYTALKLERSWSRRPLNARESAEREEKKAQRLAEKPSTQAKDTATHDQKPATYQKRRVTPPMPSVWPWFDDLSLRAQHQLKRLNKITFPMDTYLSTPKALLISRTKLNEAALQVGLATQRREKNAENNLEPVVENNNETHEFLAAESSPPPRLHRRVVCPARQPPQKECTSRAQNAGWIPRGAGARAGVVG